MRTALARRETPLTLEEILVEQRSLYVKDDYSIRFSPIYWRAVFIRWFGNEPTSDNDKRWDELFKIGYPILQALLKSSD